MVAYAVMLLFLGAAYATLVFVGSRAALYLAVLALAAALVAVYLTFRR